jgi:hypothetical protein
MSAFFFSQDIYIKMVAYYPNNKTDKKEDMEYQILDAILEAHEAEEIAQDCGLSSEEEGAALWFNEIYYDSTWHMDKMPKYNTFIKEIEGGNLYYDYGANYYFLVQRNNKNESKNMSKKNVIRLTESDLKRVISESVKKVLKEAYGQYEQTPYNNSSSIDADISNIETAVKRDRERAEIDNMVKKGWCSYANIKEVLCGTDDDDDDYDGLLSFPIIMNDTEEFNFRGRRRFKSTEKTFTPDSFCKPLKLNKPLRNWTFAVGYGGFADESDEYMHLSIYVSVKKTKIDIAVVTDNPNVDTELSKGFIEIAICDEAKKRYEEKVLMQRGR